MTGRNIFDSFGGVIRFIASAIALLPYCVRFYLYRSVCGWGGHIGALIRYVLFSRLIRKCGTNVYIKKHVYFYDIKDMVCGNNVSFHEMCYVNACGGLSIGDNVSIAHGTSILTTEHTWDVIELPIKYNKILRRSVHICNDVWIGCGVRILSGVTIGKRSIIAAGAIVTRDVEEGTMVGGCPAKIIKHLYV